MQILAVLKYQKTRNLFDTMAAQNTALMQQVAQASEGVNRLVNGAPTGLDERSGATLGFLLRSTSHNDRLIGLERAGKIAGLLRFIDSVDRDKAIRLSKWVQERAMD